MALEFPTSPTIGQEYNGFVWDGEKWSTIGTQRATQAEAEAGVENTAYMTSLRTAQAIDVQVIPGLALKVSKTGDTMSGALVLPGDPTTALQASPKQYVDAGDATLTTLVGTKVAKAGDTMTGALVLPGSPTTGLQAATKAYVDSLASGLVIKAAVAAATTASITLSGEQTIDGVVTNASRVLVKNQTAPAENGIYVSDAGAWARSTDMDAWTETLAAYTYVQAGTVNIGSSFVSQTAAGGTLGVTAIPFVLFNVNISGAVPISGGTMTGPLILSGDPSAALGATTKQFVVAKSGDTMTGALILNADPVTALGAATKQYADAGGNFIQAGTGAVTRTMQNKVRDIVNVLDFGADPTGATSSKTAFLNAIKDDRVVQIPPGSFDLGNGVQVSNLHNCSIIGAGFAATSIRMTDNTASFAFDFPGCHGCNFEEMSIYAPNGAPVFSAGFSTSGVGSGLSRVRNLWVQNFWYGILINGDAAVPMSGMIVEGCIVTGCDTGLFSKHSNDFHYVNNQWGGNDSTSSVGAQIESCSAGLYSGNYHFSFIRGLLLISCAYNRYVGNRAETNLHENVYAIGCHRSTFVGNSFFTPSLASFQAYVNVVFETCDQIAFTGNAMFTWGDPTARAAISITSDTTNIAITGNTITDYLVGPIENNSASPDTIHIVGNVPSRTQLDKPYNQTFSGTSVGAIAAGSNVYLGSNGLQTSPFQSVYVVNRAGTISALYLACSSSPGSGQSYSAQIQVNGSNTGIAVNLTDSSDSGTATGNFSVNRGSILEINFISSAGAVTARPRWVIEISG